MSAGGSGKAAGILQRPDCGRAGKRAVAGEGAIPQNANPKGSGRETGVAAAFRILVK
ncbi:hypothetical protein Busp01_44000 [Trinickia caryophylli]|nr:hypothetical protein Busp01_44000 [Trinickia caryophylli]